MSELWPHKKDNEAQRMVLGCIFVDPSLVDDDSMKNITAKHFTDPVMRDYFKLVSTNERLPVEVMLASGDDIALPLFFRRYVQELKKEWARHCEEKGRDQAEIYLDQGKTKEANEILTKLSTLSVDDEWMDFTEGYKEIFKEREYNIKHGLPMSIGTGFTTLDKVTGGMHKGQLWVIGAGIGHGKTTFAVQVARNVAKSGKKVGVFSLEMTRRSVLERFACSMAGIDYIRYVNAEINNRELVRVTNEMQDLVGLGIRFYDNPTATPDTLLGASQDQGFDLIIIDHLHRVRHTGSASLNEKAMLVANTSKTIARMNDCTVMLIGQFSREHTRRGEGSKRGRPTMNDFRDSGMIEAEADTILLLYRPSEYSDEEMDESKAEWIIPKLRFGKSGSFPMRWGGLKGWQDLEIYRKEAEEYK